MATYEFAIKEEVLNSGREIRVPVCRKKSPFSIRSYSPLPWERIVEIYGEYILMELPEDYSPDLTESECQEHIRGYQKMLMEEHRAKQETKLTNITTFKLEKHVKS